MNPQPGPATSTPTLFANVRADLPASAPLTWLARGWADMRACGPASLFYGLCFAVMGIVMALVLRRAVHLLSGLTAGFLLVGPFFAVGLYALSRQRERGEPVRLAATLGAWSSARGAIGVYSLIVIVIYLVWARASMVVFALFFDSGLPTLPAMLGALVRLENPEFFLAWFAVGGFFATLVYAVSVVSVPMMLDRDQDAVVAMLTSIVALARNPLPLALWAALIFVLIACGILAGFVGLILTGPLVGHASWHAYRALVEAPQPA